MPGPNISEARNALDRVRLKLTMFQELIAHYPSEEGLGETTIQGICVFAEDLNKELTAALRNEPNAQ